MSELCYINPSKSDIKYINNNILVSFIDMASVSNDGYIEHKVDMPLGNLRKGSYTYFAENDIIIAKITPCMENGKCAIAKGLTNNLGMGSSEFHIFRAKDVEDTSYLFYFLNRKKIRDEAEKHMTGASGHRRVPISFYENLEVPMPERLKRQQIVAQIEKYEKQIAECRNTMNDCANKKNEVLRKYLA